jgi:hypothetical protein
VPASRGRSQAGTSLPPSRLCSSLPSSRLLTPRALVELYAEKGDSKYERAALRYLIRYMPEAEPSLADVAQVAALLAERALPMRGL